MTVVATTTATVPPDAPSNPDDGLPPLELPPVPPVGPSGPAITTPDTTLTLAV